MNYKSFIPPVQTVTSGVTDHSPSSDAVYSFVSSSISSSAVNKTLSNLTTTAINASLLFGTDGSSGDIGASGASRPNNLYVKTAINLDSLTASAFIGSDSSKNIVSLTAATATSYLNTFTSTLQGLVPASGGGTTNFLRADGTWAAAGVSTSSGDQYKVLASNGTTTSFQFAGLGDGSFGTNNIFLGRGKPSGLTTGTSNILISSTGGGGITTGTGNVIVSDSAANAANFNSNVVVGTSISTAFSGSESVVVGAQITATTGSDNVVVGFGANVSGNSNSVIVGKGSVAGGSDTVVVGLGSYAGGYAVTVGRSSVSSNSGVAIGGLTYAQGSGTIAIGQGTGNSGDSGAYNTFIGVAAAYAHAKSGTRSVALGAFAGQNLSSASNVVFLGNLAGGYSTTQSNELFIDSLDRGSYANQQTQSLIYGVFNAAPESQTLVINAQTKLAYGEKHASLHGQTGTSNVITAATSNYYIGVNSSGAAKTVNLPAAATAGQGFVLVIKDEGGMAGTNNITINPNLSETIDGAATKLININYGALELITNGTNWFVM